jgi:hypothetical protein
MILAPSSPDLLQEDEGTGPPSPGQESAPINPMPHDHDHAEVPSFRPLSDRPTDAPKASERASLSKERSNGRAIVTSNPRAIARSSIAAGAIAKLVDGTPGEGSLDRVPGLVGPRRHVLLLCCVFLSGVAAGLGGARLASSAIAFQDARSALSAVWKAVGPSRWREVPFLVDHPAPSGELALPGSRRPTVSGLSSDANQVQSSTDNPEVSSEVSALGEQFERQFAEGRLDQPGNDNALDIYRKMAAIAPNDPATIALGGHLSRAIWSLAGHAIKDARWDDALHYYGILKTLPPVPLAAILGKQSLEPSEMERDALAGASSGPVGEQPPGDDTLNGTAASQDLAYPGPIAPSPRNATAPGSERPSAIIGIAMARGDAALAAGDVISARQFYELAASNGLAHAATAVAGTYDPNFLQGKGVRGALADAEVAKRWYQKAIDGGDAEARTRLDKLLKVDQGTLAR